MAASATVQPFAARLGERAGIWVRVRERLRRWQLDRELARGVPPETSRLLAFHARRLTTPRSRARVAGALESALRHAHEPTLLSARVPLRGPAIAAAHRELESLAAELRADQECHPRGAALARLLVFDGASPLYGAGPEQELVAAARKAYQALRFGEVQ